MSYSLHGISTIDPNPDLIANCGPGAVLECVLPNPRMAKGELYVALGSPYRLLEKSPWRVECRALGPDCLLALGVFYLACFKFVEPVNEYDQVMEAQSAYDTIFP